MSLGFILADKFQKPEIKEHVLESCVFSVLLYGAQTWSLTEKENEMLQTCQRKLERRILHVVWSDRVTNTEIRKNNRKDIVAVSQSQV